MYSSMDAVVEYLNKVSPDDAKVVKERYSNFDRFQGNEKFPDALLFFYFIQPFNLSVS